MMLRMTQVEKLKRMLNPTCPADYGISFALDDLCDFQEGREFLVDFFKTPTLNELKSRERDMKP